MRKYPVLSALKRLDLQRHAEWWPLALGGVLGLCIGTGALAGIGGFLGAGLCVLLLGVVGWLVKDAEPVWIRAEGSIISQEQPEAPVWVEPLEMVELDGGTFYMGSAADDDEAYEDEQPQYEATVSAFAISPYLITRELYRELMVNTPSAWDRDEADERLPANHVTWFNAVAFCNALSESVGLVPCYHIEGERVSWDRDADGYRLPTEAEWEYACRAGTVSKWFFGDDAAALDRYAWFAENSEFRTHPVGEKEPNPWGLYDMIGNVYEWCWDGYGAYDYQPVTDPTGSDRSNARVLRGGSAWVFSRFLRSADRYWFEPAFRLDFLGFRCTRRSHRQL
ncbi:MAG: hypothetical protein ETSY1_26145 [Candidatus Entotheonella factor]|uniref:Sulfatase-modifying factor enzyme-like domain-containing protein n=1 Tax=Entotheonella factor TaxID=1429438 RepID=W4LEY7_ENTF1|nr:MAG: hypothetical protein ETSY1_26145 [Candidatus Entotheonella factor]